MLLLFLAMQAAGAPQDVNVNINSCRICSFVQMLKGDPKKRHQKEVGKLLADGDCAGAEKYALENGELDLADRVKAHCDANAAAQQPAAASASRATSAQPH